MKKIWLISLLFSFIFAGQTQIVLGSYSTSSNAKRAVTQINDLVKKEMKFQDFFNKNALISTYKKDGKYFSVMIKPFNNSKVRNKVLKYFKPTFKGAYVLNLVVENKVVKKETPTKKQIAIKKTVVKAIFKKPIVKKETQPEATQVKKIEQPKERGAKEEVKEKEKTIKITDSSVLEDEWFSWWYVFLIILFAVLSFYFVKFKKFYDKY